MRAGIWGGRHSALRISTTEHGNHNHNNQQHHDPDAPPARSRSSNPVLRPPLQSTDSNAKMRVPSKGPLGAKNNNNKNMPAYDKQQNTLSRPFMPTLSATAKTTSRVPLTPRVAGSAPATSTSPLARRGGRIETTTTTTTIGSPREEITTPVSTFLSNNITPRSGSRKSRVDSNNTTPTGTPNGTPMFAPSSDGFRSLGDAPASGPGLGIMGFDKDIPKRPIVTFSPSVSDVGGSRGAAPSSGGDSKFFFASEAKAVQPTRPPILSKNSTTFVYANGEAIPTPPQSSGPSAAGSTVGEDRTQSKFFHVNGALDLPSHLPPRPSSSLSNTSRMPSTRLSGQSPSVAFSPPPLSRPGSPSKLNQYATVTSIRNSQAPADPPRPLTSGRSNAASTIVMPRRASVNTSAQSATHARTPSSGSIGKSPTSRNVSGSSIDSPLASPFGQMMTPVPSSTPEETSDVSVKNEIDPQSPIKTNHTLEQLNELAANARRERKVLDLEITNSSLAAINRTLEREMRKQTAELRRYRRLSRSGRLSIASVASMRTSTGSLSVIGEDGAILSDMSEEEEEAAAEEEETELSDEESSDEGSLSPGAIAENDLRHRKRDEKRLQLDLTKHQQLLIDSQKMNQSLKRCLGLTEELIGDCKKALEYKVRVSDIELGGRVLVPYEEGEEIETEMDHEGMSEIGVQMLREARQAAANGTAAWSSIGKDDRDSGIELEPKIKEGIAAERL